MRLESLTASGPGIVIHETVLNDLLRTLAAQLTGWLYQNRQLIASSYPLQKLLADAKKMDDNILDDREWWDRLMDVFEVPAEKRPDLMKKARKNAEAHLDTDEQEPDEQEPEEQPEQQPKRRRSSAGRKAGKRGRKRDRRVLNRAEIDT